MDTFAVLEELKLTIERDFSELRKKHSEVVSENKKLLESNGRLSEENSDLKQQQESLNENIGELQNKLIVKAEQLHISHRKLEKLQKQESWWKLYLHATEVRIGVLKKYGSFPDNVKEWLDKDVNNIITLVKNGSATSLEPEPKKLSMKLSTSKSHKRTRYSDVSPPNQHPERKQEHLYELSGQIKSSQDNSFKKVCIINKSRGNENDPAQSNIYFENPVIASKKDKSSDNNSNRGVKASMNQPGFNAETDRSTNIDVTGEMTVKYPIGPPSLTSTPIITTDEQCFFAAETQFDETEAFDLENSGLVVVAEKIRVPKDAHGTPVLSPSIQANNKSANISQDFTAAHCEKSVLVIPKEKDSDEKGDNQNKTTFKGQSKTLQSSSDKDKNCQEVFRTKNNIENYGSSISNCLKKHELPLSSHAAASKMQPDNVKSSRLVNEPGNRRIMAGESRVADVARKKTATLPAEPRRGIDQSQNKRKRESSSESDQEQGAVNQVQEKEIIYVMDSPNHVTPLFKIPAPPSSLLASAVKSPSIPPTTTSEMETSGVDLFGDLGTDHTDDSKTGDENENEETYDDGEKDALVDDAKHSDTTDIVQPPATKSTSHDFDDEFDEEGRYQEYLRQRKEPEKPYKYQEVVRKKDERAKLNGYSCRECEAYFNGLNLTEAEKKSRMKACSRHRSKFSPPPNTPEGFWNLSFPETQEYIDKGYMRSDTAGPPPRKSRRARKKLVQR